MATGRFDKYWTSVIIILLAVIAIGCIVIPPGQELQGEIYIGGAVNNPGFYPLKTGDSIEDIIQAAGGITDSANPGVIELIIPENKEFSQSQKIDINRAEVWLL